MDIATDIFKVISNVVLSKAAGLVRKGQYVEAEQLLASTQTDSPNPMFLDLLARIRVRQGRSDEALVLWKEALRHEPDNKCYETAIKRLSQIGNKPVWIFAPLTYALAGLIIIAGFFVFAWPRFTVIDTFQRKAKTIKALPYFITSPKLEIHIPGVLLDNENGKLIIRFEKGLFVRGVKFAPQSSELLKVLSEQLKPYSGQIRLNIEGHTDILPIPADNHAYIDNTSLGINRAVKVADVLRKNTGFPENCIVITGYGESKPLCADGRQKENRSVIIRVIGNQK